ncbi:calmodulin-binding protein 25-like [Pistacia vera]|uniref:calmodulin-binding protein 25-like n=1 Tax=Pistacia vera TaxID=55513 RepID=UPI0012638052|nr:calmodulin-binding protein 25-like [Pistacia vera]XP_031262263.1 calmodulin-binding protein 25-like [Pistacia vera]
MTSSENLPALTASWAFRDPWFSEVSAHETETLTKALQKTFSTSTTNFNNNNNNSVSEAFASDFISPFVNPETPTVSNVSGSDPETSLPKRQRNGVSGPNSGKISKRKSRASKRTQTTFITADPANFRQMVQQVTGAKYGNSQGSVPSILKPEPQRLGGRLPGIGHGGGCLPTLDTSAFLLDHHQQQVAMGSGSGPVGGPGVGSGPFNFQTSVMGDGGSSGFDFDALSSFPTLESWKVM